MFHTQSDVVFVKGLKVEAVIGLIGSAPLLSRY